MDNFLGEKKKIENVLTQKLNSVFEARRGVKKEGKTQRSKDTPDKKENLNLPDKGGSDLIESRCAAPRSDSGCDSLQLANPPPYTHTHFHKPSGRVHVMCVPPPPMLTVLAASTC